MLLKIFERKQGCVTNYRKPEAKLGRRSLCFAGSRKHSLILMRMVWQLVSYVADVVAPRDKCGACEGGTELRR